MASDQSPEPGSQNAPKQQLSGARLLKSTSVVSSMTFLSRVLGLVRDIVFARFFGASIVMDAFLIANRIPNMLRRFFAEGAFAQGFVPVLSRYREQHGDTETKQLIDAVAGTFGRILFLITLAGVVVAPILVTVVAPGFVGEDGRFDLATAMLRFTFPYLLFVSLTAFAGGILNTYGRFAVPAFTPVILNIVLISGALWIAPALEEPGMALAYAVFVAGLIQLLFQIPFLSRIHAVPRPRWQPHHPGVKRIKELMLPAIFGSSVAQINVLIGGIIASYLGVGKISYLYFSDRLMEFPLGLFGIALATVTLPYLSRQHASQSHSEFSDTIDWSMKLILVIATPAAIGLIVLSEPLVATIYFGREFTVFDSRMTVLALRAFALGLVGFSYVKILAPAYFARENTRTPVRFGLIALAVNFVLSLVLAYVLTRADYEGSHVGLALATSVSAVLYAWLLYRGLLHDDVLRHSSGWGKLFMQVVAAIIVMTLCLVSMERPLDWWVEAAVIDRLTWLSASVLVGVAVYFAVLLMLGLRPSHFRLRSG